MPWGAIDAVSVAHDEFYLANGQMAKGEGKAAGLRQLGLGLGVRKLHFAGEKLAEETEKLLRAERYRMVDPFESKICDMYV